MDSTNGPLGPSDDRYVLPVFEIEPTTREAASA